MPVIPLITVLVGSIGGFVAGRYVLPKQELPSCVESLISKGVDKDRAVEFCAGSTKPASVYSIITPVVVSVALIAVTPKVIEYITRRK